MGTAARHLRIALSLSVLLVACGRPAPPPSFLLVVLDTTRADAVSAYGSVSDTTPVLDRLAADGIRFAHAYTNANWTVPSHATLFTGLLPSEHGVRQIVDGLPTNIPTLAEELGARGYQTAGVSENIWIGDSTGIPRGFEWTVVGAGEESLPIVHAWLARRDRTKPFLLFVNIFDPHIPYVVRRTNPFLPAGVTAEEARAISQDPAHNLCLIPRRTRELEVLRGLYLGDVHAADAKLGALLQLVRSQMDGGSLISVVTSDHGEYFGESGLVAHDIGIGQPVIHVPLVVHGLPSVPPTTVETPVQLADVMPSILSWAGVAVPAGLTGRVLPLRDGAAPAARTIVAEYSDLCGDARVRLGTRKREASRRHRCIARHRIFGDRRAVLRFPYEFMWYAHYDAQLFDVRADPAERHDILAAHAAIAAKLGAVAERLAHAPAAQGTVSGVVADRDTTERLRALGYLGGPVRPAETSP